MDHNYIFNNNIHSESTVKLSWCIACNNLKLAKILKILTNTVMMNCYVAVMLDCCHKCCCISNYILLDIYQYIF